MPPARFYPEERLLVIEYFLSRRQRPEARQLDPRPVSGCGLGPMIVWAV